MTDREVLRSTLQTKMEQLWNDVSIITDRETADRVRWEAIQACHAWHRAVTPAYRERCEREGIGKRLERSQLSAVALPEEIFKAYAQAELPNGEKLGAFCERNVPLLIEKMSYYLSQPITMEGLQENYMSRTNIQGGLDRLRADLHAKQGVYLLTSSGTGGSAFALIPCGRELLETTAKANHRMFDLITYIPEYGPIDPKAGCLVGYAPREGSMMMSFGLKLYADLYEERAFFAIPARVQSRELRWRAGAFAGTSGKVLQALMKPLLKFGGKRTSAKGAENFIAGLKEAEALGLRTLVFANPWMALNGLARMEAVLAEEVAQGKKQAGEPLVTLAPGSVLLMAGGNKAGSDIPAETIVARFHRLIGGITKTLDAYGQSESLSGAIQCAEGNYHFDSHMEFFIVDGYLAYYDPRQFYRVPGLLTGDNVDAIYEEPCACGNPARYFKHIARDNANRGSKGCAAALAEYA